MYIFFDQKIVKMAKYIEKEFIQEMQGKLILVGEVHQERIKLFLQVVFTLPQSCL